MPAVTLLHDGHDLFESCYTASKHPTPSLYLAICSSESIIRCGKQGFVVFFRIAFFFLKHEGRDKYQTREYPCSPQTPFCGLSMVPLPPSQHVQSLALFSNQQPRVLCHAAEGTNLTAHSPPNSTLPFPSPHFQPQVFYRILESVLCSPPPSKEKGLVGGKRPNLLSAPSGWHTRH